MALAASGVAGRGEQHAAQLADALGHQPDAAELVIQGLGARQRGLGAGPVAVPEPGPAVDRMLRELPWRTAAGVHGVREGDEPLEARGDPGDADQHAVHAAGGQRADPRRVALDVADEDLELLDDVGRVALGRLAPGALQAERGAAAGVERQPGDLVEQCARLVAFAGGGQRIDQLEGRADAAGQLLRAVEAARRRAQAAPRAVPVPAQPAAEAVEVGDLDVVRAHLRGDLLEPALDGRDRALAEQLVATRAIRAIASSQSPARRKCWIARAGMRSARAAAPCSAAIIPPSRRSSSANRKSRNRSWKRSTGVYSSTAVTNRLLRSRAASIAAASALAGDGPTGVRLEFVEDRAAHDELLHRRRQLGEDLLAR